MSAGPRNITVGVTKQCGKEFVKNKTSTIEILYAADPEQVLERAEELVEGIQTALIPDAGHLLQLEQPELCNSHMLDFLSGDE